MRIKKLFLPVVLIVGMGMLFQGCNKIVGESTSGTKLIVSKVTGINWENKESSILYSDVIVETEGKPATVQDDLAKIYLIATPYSPDVENTSLYYDVIIDRYHVKYVRDDGRNVEGVDVPRAFWGSVSARIVADGNEHDITLIVVRANAKIERPLVELRYGGDGKEIECTAEIELYGEDLGGHSVYVKANLPIVFANFANEQQ